MKKIIPKCHDGSKSFIAANGRWLPCCSFPNYGEDFKSSPFAADDFLISNNADIDNFHEKNSFKEFLKKTEADYNASYDICKTRCSYRAHELNNKNETVSWVMDERFKIESNKDLLDFVIKKDIEIDGDELI
jgi:hypothetical protein